VYLPVVSPYTGEKIGEVPVSTAADVDTVVQKAQAAFAGWRATPIKERTQILLKWRELMLANLDRMSHTAASECGKLVDEARAGILKGLEVTEFAASLQNMATGGVLEVSRGVQCEMRHEPLGVVAGITPFNFPAMVPMWMYPVALVLGNCFVLKPSEKVPLTSQIIGELIVKAGFPVGVFSIVNGDRKTVEALTQHPFVQAVGFVGSTPVAKSVYQNATQAGKRALTLGGAKNAIILLPDADPDVAVRGILDSFTGCGGQRCMAASLVYAVGPVDATIEKIVAAAKKIELGNMMGAIIDKVAMKRISDAIDQAAKDGAKILVDGRKFPAPKGYEGGNWLGPTIIDGAKPEMACTKDEIFGPVLTIMRVGSLPQAMTLEHANPFGNATSVFTTQGAAARYVTDNASAGMLGVNIGVPVPREPFSFGGTKQSKFGSGDITGVSAVDFWTWRKKITTKWSLAKDNNWMS